MGNDLADRGGFSKQYRHADPASALIELRTIAEAEANDLCVVLSLPRPDVAAFFALLDGQPFKDSMSQVVLAKIDAVRRRGNKTAHGGSVNFDMAQ